MSFNQAQHDEVISRRHKIVMDYCKQKGWDINTDEMGWDKILEIRGLQKWKDVPENVLQEIKA